MLSVLMHPKVPRLVATKAKGQIRVKCSTGYAECAKDDEGAFRWHETVAHNLTDDCYVEYRFSAWLRRV